MREITAASAAAFASGSQASKEFEALPRVICFWILPLKPQNTIALSSQERSQLTALIRKGKSPAMAQLKARILLHADTSKQRSAWTDSLIAEALGTYPIMCGRVRRQWVEEGLDAVLSRKKRATPPTPPIFDGETEAKLIALACSPPPPGRSGWTLRLLEEKVVELKIVDHASDNTIGRV